MAFRVYSPQVGQGGLPGYRQRVDDQRAAGAAAFAEGAQRAAEGFQRVQEEQDTAAVQDAWAKLIDNKQQLLDNPDKGFVTTQKGQAAIAGRDGVINAYDAAAKGLSDNLNQRQRDRFERLLAADRPGFRDAVDRHVAGESQVVRAQSREAALSAAMNDAISAAKRGDDDQVHTAIGNGAGVLARSAAGEGWDAAYTEEQRRAWTTQTHLGVIDTMMDAGRTTAAQQYLEAHRGEMDAALLARSNVEKTVRLASDAETGARAARAAIGSAATTVVRPWDPSTPIPHVDTARVRAQLDKLEADPDVPEHVKLAAREHMEALIRSSDASWKATLDDVYDRAVTKLSNNGWWLSALGQEQSFLLSKDVDGGKVWQSILAHRDAVLRERANEPPTPAQRASMVEFWTTLGSNQDHYAPGDEGAFKSFIADWGSRLAPSDLEQAAAAVGKIGLGAARPDETLPSFAVARIKQVGSAAGMWDAKGPKDDDQNRRYLGAVSGLLQKQADLRHQGKTLDDATVKQFLNEWGAKGRVPGTGIFWDDKVSRGEFETNPEYAGKYFAEDRLFEEDIPKDKLEGPNGIREHLKANGLPVTKEWERWMWLDAHGVPPDQNPAPRAVPSTAVPPTTPVEHAGR